uniref:Reverse transcriptase domain-containing protein n=1 Tax=Trichobilharzia regenti TaxID=157069 RepID=A0AA85J531_TRIRE
MDTGTYPSEWKTSFIIPHYKSGDRANVRNYRPINITPVISRIMEKVVKDQLSDYLIREDLVTRSQHGFLKNRSCVTCHFDFFNCITSSREARKLVVVLYFDISRAFDMVSHSILFEKLYSCGIRNPLLNWLKSFLSNRVQITKVGSVLSHPRQISSGVVQGSVLGPLLFTVYINSICKCFTSGKPFLYADDLKVVYSCYTHELSDMVTKIHLELSSLATWCAESCLNFNIDKCGWICIGNSKLDLTLEINGRKLAKLNSVVDLGIRYSSNLTFAEQTDYARRKTRRLIGCITRNFFCCETRVLLYKVCVRPILEYCPFILSGLRQNDKLKLEGVQRQFTSRTLGLESGLEYHERCERLRLEPLWKRRLKLNLIFYYKLTNLLLHSSEPITKPTAVISYNLRNHHNLAAMEHCQTYVRYNFFLNKFSVIWNRLPANVRDANTLPVFISSVTRLLKDDNALLRLTLTPSFSPYIDILSSLN